MAVPIDVIEDAEQMGNHGDPIAGRDLLADHELDRDPLVARTGDGLPAYQRSAGWRAGGPSNTVTFTYTP